MNYWNIGTIMILLVANIETENMHSEVFHIKNNKFLCVSREACIEVALFLALSLVIAMWR